MGGGEHYARARKSIVMPMDLSFQHPSSTLEQSFSASGKGMPLMRNPPSAYGSSPFPPFADLLAGTSAAVGSLRFTACDAGAGIE